MMGSLHRWPHFWSWCPDISCLVPGTLPLFYALMQFLDNTNKQHIVRVKMLYSFCLIYSSSPNRARRQGTLEHWAAIPSMMFTLLTVHFIQCLLSLPYCLHFILNLKFSFAGPVLYFLSLTFQYINHSCNFFLNCLSGRTFRRELLTWLSCRAWLHKLRTI